MSSGIHQAWHFSAVRKTWCLTFAGFRAARTVKQLTQEAMTSTGREITVVNLVGEQCTVLSKMNNTTCSITNIFQFSLPKSLLAAGMWKQESPQLGIDTTPGLSTVEHVRTLAQWSYQILTAAAACRCGTWWAGDSLLSTGLYWWPYGPDQWWVWPAGSAESHLRGKEACDLNENNSFKITEQGLPWWRSGWESTCQCRGCGFKPWSRRIPHAVERLGPCATAAELVLWSPQATTTKPECCNCWSLRAWSPCSAAGEATAMRSLRTAARSGPRSPQLERARAQQRRPNAAKKKRSLNSLWDPDEQIMLITIWKVLNLILKFSIFQIL